MIALIYKLRAKICLLESFFKYLDIRRGLYTFEFINGSFSYKNSKSFNSLVVLNLIGFVSIIYYIELTNIFFFILVGELIIGIKSFLSVS